MDAPLSGCAWDSPRFRVRFRIWKTKSASNRLNGCRVAYSGVSLATDLLFGCYQNPEPVPGVRNSCRKVYRSMLSG